MSILAFASQKKLQGSKSDKPSSSKTAPFWQLKGLKELINAWPVAANSPAKAAGRLPSRSPVKTTICDLIFPASDRKPSKPAPLSESPSLLLSPENLSCWNKKLVNRLQRKIKS